MIAKDEGDGDVVSGGESGGELKQNPNSTETDRQQMTKPRTQQKAGKIGEGKNMSLSKNQRKRALQMEQFRQPLIRSNPEFVNNPFQTIRTHAQNTLVKHQTPS